MAALGATSLANLAGVKPQTLDAANALAALATADGMDFSIPEYGGLRTVATQEQLAAWEADSVAGGGAPYDVAAPGHSKHETGDAFDIKLNVWPDSMTEDQAYSHLGGYAAQLGLKWGGTFSTPDVYHFQNASISATGTTVLEVILGILGLAGLAYVLTRGSK